jgi:molecular chaperone DnaK (HSP70)
MTSLTDDYLFVAAIDIGTTYSGYAFSSRDDFKKDPMKIIANQAWNTGCQRHLSLKTPTCLLLDDNEEFVSFGYEAENKYSDIVIDRKKNEYFFFQRFKMQLYKIKVSNLFNLNKITSLICSSRRGGCKNILRRVICQ